MRLERLKQEYAPETALDWKAYPLVIGNIHGRRFGAYLAQAWARAGQEEPTITFQPWTAFVDLPSSSLPALEAAKCAELQGQDAFERYHKALFRAYFEQSRDISRREVLVSLAEEAGLNTRKLTSDLDKGGVKEQVLADYRNAKELGTFTGIPTVIFPGGAQLEGAVPADMYRHIIEQLLNK